VLLLGTASPSASAQDELDESPVQTLAEDSPPPKRVKKKSASLSDAPEPLSPKQADKKARELFETGRVAWEDGRFREAWEHWHLSYRLSRKPALLYNVGQAADRLRMDREALEAFRMYLEKNPSAENRREVEQRIEILERSVAAQPPRDSGASLEAQPDTLAEDPSEPSLDAPYEETSDSSAEDDPSHSGQPRRSGVYVRASAGFGLLADSISDNAGTPASLGAATFALEGAVGYGVLEKLVVGGMLSLDYVLGPEVSQNGGGATEINSMSLLLISGFAHYYLSPKQHGWHLLGGLGIGRLAISGAVLGNQDGGGGALFAGGGYDMPLSDEWVLAFNARLLVGRFSQDVFDHTLIAPTVTVGAVWF
jgi:hypothetical protein